MNTRSNLLESFFGLWIHRRGAPIARALCLFQVLFLAPSLVASATFVATGSMAYSRAFHTATLLRDGRTLVTGRTYSIEVEGETVDVYDPSAELYNPATGSWSLTGSLTGGRIAHTATLLRNGKVLVAGGYAGAPLATAEIYDPATGSWTTINSMNLARSEHTATLLPNGKVLVVGGSTTVFPGYTANSAEIYDPATGNWTYTGSMSVARRSPGAALLPNGKVLVSGGFSPGGVVASAEIYDPATALWSNTGSMSTARTWYKLTSLLNGKVLASGGWSGSSDLASSEVYDPSTGLWSSGGSFSNARRFHAATLLPEGTVLVAGGYSGSGSISSASLFNPTTVTWSALPSMNSPRSLPTSTLLPNGKVLVAGGNVSSADLYTPNPSDPKSAGPNSYSTVIYASTGTQVIPRFQSPSSGYSISRRLNLSAFFNQVNSTYWGFDATSIPINGTLKIPSGAGPFPLAIFVHGNHSPTDYSDQGYVYLCELLASWGILAATIDANFLNGSVSGENDARAILHLEHVRQFEIWNGTSGHALQGKVDLNHVMLVGHSRGGEGAGHASFFNTYGGNVPVALNGSAGLGPYLYPLQAIVGIAPTDSQYVHPVEGATKVYDNYFIIHGSRDFDVWPFNGYATYDRAQPINLSNPTADTEGFKSLLWVVGANHNYFNSAWLNENGSTAFLTRTEQENVAKVYVSAVAQATLLGKDDYMELLKHYNFGKTWLPSAASFISQYQAPKRRFINHYEEDTTLSTVSPPNSGSNSSSATSVSELFFQTSPATDYYLFQETRGVRLNWSSTSHYYLTSLSGSGLDGSSQSYLGVNVSQSAETSNPSGGNQNFTVQVSDANGATAEYHASAFSAIPYPDTGRFGYKKLVMQSLRVPLPLLIEQGVCVTKISGVKLLFDRVGSGTVYFDAIQLSK